MSLEEIMRANLGDSIVNEVSKQFNDYLHNLKNFAKNVAPAFLASILGTYLGQNLFISLGGQENFANTFVGYWSGAAFGYPVFLGMEYFRNRENYIGKEGIERFRSFCANFVVADWVGDAVSYAPVYGLVDTLVTKFADFEAGVSGALGCTIGGTTYTLFMSAFMPATHRISGIANSKIKEFISKIPTKVKSEVNIAINNTSLYLDKIPLMF